MKRDTIFTALRELEAAGLLTRTRRDGTSNVYHLTCPEKGAAPQNGTTQTRGRPLSRFGGREASPETGHKGSPPAVPHLKDGEQEQEEAACAAAADAAASVDAASAAWMPVDLSDADVATISADPIFEGIDADGVRLVFADWRGRYLSFRKFASAVDRLRKQTPGMTPASAFLRNVRSYSATWAPIIAQTRGAEALTADDY